MSFGKTLKNIKDTKGKEYIDIIVNEQFEVIKKQCLIRAQQGMAEYLYVIPNKYQQTHIINNLLSKLKEEELKFSYYYTNETILIKW